MPKMPPTSRVAEGYMNATIHAFTAAKVRALGGGEWRPPIHGTYVMVAPDGSVLATVRTLGIQLPRRDRRYSLRVRGVTFERLVPLISATRPIKSDLAPYDSPEAAKAAGSALICQMVDMEAHNG